jgi:16S rRNA (adenine1518-N6/adenine1519-N6)-dimethyltransferase
LDINHRAKKRFGQNFLVDDAVISQIVGAINPKQGDAIVEIGPGLGALTKLLLPRAEKLDVVEFDRDIIPKLQRNCEGLGELTVHECDVLKFDFKKLKPAQGKLTVVGNLPYNISTPLLFHLTEYRSFIKSMTFMLQKEVVKRICAQTGTKAYGRLTVMLNYFYQCFELFEVPPTAFNPPPKVDSAIVRLQPHNELPFVAKDFELFSKLVTQAFSLRRKTLRNCLKGLVNDEQFAKAEIDPGVRAEQVSVEQFVRLSNVLSLPD